MREVGGVGQTCKVKEVLMVLCKEQANGTNNPKKNRIVASVIKTLHEKSHILPFMASLHKQPRVSTQKAEAHQEGQQV